MKRVILTFAGSENLLHQAEYLISHGVWRGGSILFRTQDDTPLLVLADGWTAGDRFEIALDETHSGRFALTIRDQDGRYMGSADEELVEWIDL